MGGYCTSLGAPSQYKDWASSTGLIVVRKFKPRLPAQWAVGAHHKGSSYNFEFD